MLIFVENRFMKQVLLALLLIAAGDAFSQSHVYNIDSLQKEQKAFEKYGLHQYWLVLIRPGETDFTDDIKKKVMESHFANMKVLSEKGVLKLAGPMGKNDLGWSGIFVFDCLYNDLDHYLSGDEAINSGYFKVEYAPWYAEPTSSLKLADFNKPDEAKDEAKTEEKDEIQTTEVKSKTKMRKKN